MAMCTGCIACGLIAMRTTRARSVAARTTAADAAGSRRKRWLDTKKLAAPEASARRACSRSASSGLRPSTATLIAGDGVAAGAAALTAGTTRGQGDGAHTHRVARPNVTILRAW